MTTYLPRVDRAITWAVLAGLAWWGYLHYETLEHVSLLHSPREIVYLSAYLLIVWQTVLIAAHPRFRATSRQQARLDAMTVVVPVPVRNEDPSILRRCLESLLTQSRLPQIVHVVDNDSDDPAADYEAVRAWFLDSCAQAHVTGVWDAVTWKGKRLVHEHVARRWERAADLYLTVDSDSVLSHDAIHQLLLPLVDNRVQSVAGLVLSENATANPLTRILDLWFTATQLVGRASQSTLGAVTVNSGPLAVYRFPVVIDNIAGYVHERFLGRPVHFSDDSMLTLYALERGRAVQNPHAIAESVMPEHVSHMIRQYLRWMRGSTIRSIWRFRYLSLTTYAYWVNVLNWVQLVASVAVLADLYVLWPIEGHTLPWHQATLIGAILGWAFTARYLAVKRPSERLRSRVLTWLLAPFAVAWSYLVLRTLRWYGMATCYKTGWGTRDRIEVFDQAHLSGPRPAPVFDADAPTLQLEAVR